MAGRIGKVTNVRFHTGVSLLGTVLTGVDAVRNKVEMYRLTDGSVYIKQPKEFLVDKIISSGNIVEITIAQELEGEPK